MGKGKQCCGTVYRRAKSNDFWSLGSSDLDKREWQLHLIACFEEEATKNLIYLTIQTTEKSISLEPCAILSFGKESAPTSFM